MSWVLILILVVTGFLILMPLLTYLSSRRMIGRQVETGESDDKGRLLYFYSPACGPCRSMTPLIDRLAREHGNVGKIDVQQDPDTARRFGVRATPTTVLVKGNIVKGVVLGAKSLKQLEKLLAEIA